MKINSQLFIIAILIACISCKKNDDPIITDNYFSLDDFFLRNEIPIQTYIVDGRNGGTFKTPQGTRVTIPPMSFLDYTNSPIIDKVAIQFKDIYKKSDMLISMTPTISYYGTPIKSGGEFFINANYNYFRVFLASDKKITVVQPVALTGGLDSINSMMPFQRLSLDGNEGWASMPQDSVESNAIDYIYSLYKFNSNFLDQGSWCNSDNSSFFSSFPQTVLTLHANDVNATNFVQVFLIFKKINTMIHVYKSGLDFQYLYAPIGLECTLVALDVKNGSLYSSFVPITISSNQTINFSLSQTTTEAFMSKLKSLD